MKIKITKLRLNEAGDFMPSLMQKPVPGLQEKSYEMLDG
jgi:hypothetical protein